MHGGWLAVALVVIAPTQMSTAGRPALVDPSTGTTVGRASETDRRAAARWRAVGQTQRVAQAEPGGQQQSAGEATPPVTLPTIDASTGAGPPTSPTDPVAGAQQPRAMVADRRAGPGSAFVAQDTLPVPHGQRSGIPPTAAPVSAGPASQPPVVTVQDPGTGLVWREYDIQPYTLRVTSTRRPEQGVIDWILRTTGTHVWHGEEPAVLAADHRRLRVYHNESVQQHVAQLLPRFTAAGVDQFALRINVLTVGDPGWRREFYRLLQPLPQEQRDGRASSTRIWTLQPEDAALVLSQLRARNDYHDHGSPYMLVHNGQTATLQATHDRSYVNAVRQTPGTWPGFQTELGTIQEGLTLELSPLAAGGAAGSSRNAGGAVELYMQGNVQHVERLHDVTVDAPAVFSAGQRAYVQVPQLAQIAFEERVVWPTGKVLVINPGMVPLPTPEAPRLLNLGGPPRGDLLIFIEMTAADEALQHPLAETPQQAVRPQYRYSY